ncbi:ATP-dependent RNA helicase DDX3X [Nematocida minor]|uniref:ATP-dependent RNA helicase DDX3X n=1 Tax=Nematocida minor TaxID=1912983 RepID=UPI00221E6778|nr:ATP-dependent RNA helicase DDX3X [Nematocida minor]KAI5189123.1 ATP-dependent RNA helicase DDX3X [Nematocida minor]
MNTANYVPPCMSKKEEKLVEKEENGVRIKSADAITAITTFKGNLINMKILENMEGVGITKPTLVQRYVVPLGMHGRDLLISAPTGMGKTISFLVPTINYLLSHGAYQEKRFKSGYQKSFGKSSSQPKRPIRGLVLTPTRELALQIYNDCEMLTNGLSLSAGYAYGGSEKHEQISILKKGVDLLIGTPGRIQDFADRKTIDLSNIQVLIFDEADRMLDMGFEKQIKEILQHLNPNTERQTMMFSATFPEPVQKLARAFFQKVPAEVHVGHGPLENIKQEIVHIEGYDQNRVKRNEKLMELLLEYGYAAGDKPIEKTAVRSYSRQSPGMKMQWARKETAEPEKVKKQEREKEKEKPKIVIFVDQKVDCKELASFLNRKGIECASIHGDKMQSEREDALHEFKNNISPILAATSVAARGLDIPGIALVINYAMPADIKDYIHRIGRTGRAGKDGRAVTFITKEDYSHAPALIDILKKANQKIPSFLEEVASMRVKSGRGGHGRESHRQSSAGVFKKREDSGQHFQNTQEIKHKDAPVLTEKVKIVKNIDWTQEIS